MVNLSKESKAKNLLKARFAFGRQTENPTSSHWVSPVMGFSEIFEHLGGKTMPFDIILFINNSNFRVHNLDNSYGKPFNFISSSFCSLEISTFDKSMFRDDRFPSNTSVLRGFSHAPTTGMKNPPLRYRSIQFLICHLKVPGRPPRRATAWDILR